GVVAVYTGANMASAGVGSLPCGWLVRNKDGSPMVEPPHQPLCVGRVRHVGDQVAVIIADTRQHAAEAAALVDVEYKETRAVASIQEAIAPDAAQVWDEAPDNTCYDWEIGD